MTQLHSLSNTDVITNIYSRIKKSKDPMSEITSADIQAVYNIPLNYFANLGNINYNLQLCFEMFADTLGVENLNPLINACLSYDDGTESAKAFCSLFVIISAHLIHFPATIKDLGRHKGLLRLSAMLSVSNVNIPLFSI